MPPLTFSGSGFVSPQGSHQNGSLRHSMEYTLAICPIFRDQPRPSRPRKSSAHTNSQSATAPALMPNTNTGL